MQVTYSDQAVVTGWNFVLWGQGVVEALSERPRGFQTVSSDGHGYHVGAGNLQKGETKTCEASGR